MVFWNRGRNPPKKLRNLEKNRLNDRIDHLDFLFGEPSFLGRLDPNKTQNKSFFIDADGLELTNKLQQKRVARECAQWIQGKVDIRTIKQSNLLHGKMYRVANGGVEEPFSAVRTSQCAALASATAAATSS
jgi:hypothetical protein